MTDTLTVPTRTDPAAEPDLIDGMELFRGTAFDVLAHRAADQLGSAVVCIPTFPVGGLTGVSYALLQVFVEQRLRDALRRAGFTSVERRRGSPTDELVATR